MMRGTGRENGWTRAVRTIGVLAAPLFLAGCFGACCLPPPSPEGTLAKPFAVENPARLRPGFDDDLHSLLQSAADMRRYIAPDITVSLGVESGREAFFEMWKDPEAEEPWGRFMDEIDRLVAQGAAELDGGRRLIFPHYAHVIDPDVDPYALAWLEEGAVVRRKQKSWSEEVATGGTRTVECVVLMCRDRHPGWRMVRVATGDWGYVREGELRPVLADYRATFERRGGTWVLTVLVKGD